MIKIAFDVMGSDRGASVAIEAAFKFLKTHQDLMLIFYGDEIQIKENIEINQKKYKIKSEQFGIYPTTEVIDSHGSILDVRRKKDASIVKALEAVKNKSVDAMLTAGSSAAFIAGAQTIIGNIPGVKRSAFMPTIPTIVDNKVTLLLDCGANLENSPEELLQYAQMGIVYSKVINNVESPLVGLMNIGEEESKGRDLQKEAYKLMQTNLGKNFYGNIEPRYLASGVVDVMVADGYSGNIALKSAEGMAKNIMREVKNQMTKSFWRKLGMIGVLPLIPAFKGVTKKFNYKNHAGAILIGIDGIVFKSHGSSDLKSFEATLRMTYQAVKNDVLKKISEGMKEYHGPSEE